MSSPDLEANGLIAINLAWPLNYQSMQLKGVVAGIGDCTTQDRARVAAHLARFVEETVSVGPTDHREDRRLGIRPGASRDRALL